MLTSDSLCREDSPAPGQEIILAVPGASPDQCTTISILDIKTLQPQGLLELSRVMGPEVFTAWCPRHCNDAQWVKMPVMITDQATVYLFNAPAGKGLVSWRWPVTFLAHDLILLSCPRPHPHVQADDKILINRSANAKGFKVTPSLFYS